MTKNWKIAIVCICAVPVLIGVALIAANALSASSLAPRGLKKIGLVRITDIILSLEPYAKQLRTFREDDAVAGVLLRIDSPGGAAAPSQELFHEVMKFRDVNKPLVVSIGAMAASGGYYIASAAKRIFANPGSITGSIGVVFRFPQYFKLMDKLGISVQVLKSGDLKDIGSPQREMTPQEKNLLEKMLADVHGQFIEDVGRGRSMAADSLRPIADGRILTGRQALAAGLVDTLGSLEDAAAYLKSSLGISQKSSMLEKKRQESFLRSLIFGEAADRIAPLATTFYPAGVYFLFDGRF